MEEQRQPSWGHLEKRYGNESRTSPRRLLALDSGGIRGILTLQVLIRMGDVLSIRFNALEVSLERSDSQQRRYE